MVLPVPVPRDDGVDSIDIAPDASHQNGSVDYSTLHLGAVMTPAQEESLEAMKARAEAHETFGGNPTYCDPVILRRFLIARAYRLDHGYQLWEDWAKWKAETKPEAITLDMVRRELETGKAKVEGQDKWGRPTILLKCSKHHKGEFTPEETLKGITYLIEQATAQSRKHADGYLNLVFDCADMGYSNMDLGLAIKKPGIITIFQLYYPETMAKLIFLNANFLFRGFFSLVQPFLADRIKHKVMFVASWEEMLELYDVEGLPQEYQAQAREAARAHTGAD